MHSTVRSLLVVALVLGLTVAGPVGPALAANDVADTVTFVESDVRTDTTWTSENGPYRVIRDVRVHPGATLTIAAGTDVQFADGVTLTVAGSLSANGTASDHVRLRTTPGASAEARWSGLRYEGDSGSALTLSNADFQQARDGIVVASDRGTITVEDSTVENVAGHGIAVREVASTPTIAVRGTDMRDVGGHGIAATPASGVLESISLQTAADTPAASTRHHLSLVPGVETTVDALELEYGGHGSVAGVDAGAIARFGLDTDDDPDVDRSLRPLLEGVHASDGRLSLSLSRAVTVPGDARLVLAVNGVQNPRTRGVYPVDVTLSAAGVPQHAEGVHATLVVGDVTTEYADTTVARPTSVADLSVRESTFQTVGGAGVFVDADRVRDVDLVGTVVESAAGDAVNVRARRLATHVRGGDLTATADGLDVAVRETARLTLDGTAIHDARTGIRVRQSGGPRRATIRIDARHLTLTDNDRYGINADTATGVLTDLTFANSTVSRNGAGGLSLSHWAVRDGRIADTVIRDNGGPGLTVEAREVTATRIVDDAITGNGGDGIQIHTWLSARDLSIRNATVANNAGHGVGLWTDLVADDAAVRDNRLSNNAGAGLVVASPLSHGGAVTVAENLVVANAYGIHVAGALQTSLTGNDVVYNTNAFASPVPIDGVDPGTGVSVSEGAAGVVLDRGATDQRLADLVADPRIDAQLVNAVAAPETAVVLRTDGDGHARIDGRAALTVDRVAEELPTGVALARGGNETGVTMHANDVYGQQRGLVVAVAPLVDANTTARLLVDGVRTVTAERTYWGAETGPFHDSILPSGDGATVETQRGWVDFVPFATQEHGDGYARPEAMVTATPSAVPGETVVVNGTNATDADGRVARYHFVVDGERRAPQTDPTLSTAMTAHAMTVEMGVEDDLGIDSETLATVTVEPAAAATATPGTSTADGPPTAPPNSGHGGLAATVAGLLGGGLYLSALVLGAYGMWVTMQRRNPPFEGRTVQALAVVGVLVWAVGGLVAGSGLATVAVAAGATWALLTGVAYLLASR